MAPIIDALGQVFSAVEHHILDHVEDGWSSGGQKPGIVWANVHCPCQDEFIIHKLIYMTQWTYTQTILEVFLITF